MRNDVNPEQLVSGVHRAPQTVAVRPIVVVVAALAVLLLLGIMITLVFSKAASLIPSANAATPSGIVLSAAPANVADLGYAPEPAVQPAVTVTLAPGPPAAAPTIDPALLGGAPVAPPPPPTVAQESGGAPPPQAVPAPVIVEATESPAVRSARDRAATRAAEKRAAVTSDLEVQFTHQTHAGTGYVASANGGAGYSNGPPASRAANRYTSPDDYDIPPGSDFVLQRGEFIPATLYTSIDSTVAGLITGYVNADVWDGQHEAVVVPRGSKLIGTFGSGVSQGQQRIGVAWDSIKLPNGHTIVLEDFPGVDLTGTSGFGAAVDNHTRRLFTNVILLSILSAGAQLAQPRNSTCGGGFGGCSPSLGQSAAQSVGTNIANAETQIFQRDANITPTMHVVEGAQVGIMVLRDLPMRAWRQAR